MLLNMEKKFTRPVISGVQNIELYPYYQGARSLKQKYGEMTYSRLFCFAKDLQNKINDKLKRELEQKGIKNKKRIGLGEEAVYNNVKIYLRQSAKEIICSYDERRSAANNSLYVFSLRNSNQHTKVLLQYLCGFLNSKLVTFFAQKRNIIRFTKGKQPQMKISDLKSISIPMHKSLVKKISSLVSDIYKNKKYRERNKKIIDGLVYDYYRISDREVGFINNSIRDF
ncbi:TaqI-like C-terminal specificity domain-containing protein [Candidatus Riflebacteria bacterium]